MARGAQLDAVGRADETLARGLGGEAAEPGAEVEEGVAACGVQADEEAPQGLGAELAVDVGEEAAAQCAVGRTIAVVREGGRWGGGGGRRAWGGGGGSGGSSGGDAECGGRPCSGRRGGRGKETAHEDREEEEG